MSAASDDGGDVVAAAWTGRPGCITLDQAKLMLRAAQSLAMTPQSVLADLRGIAGVETPQEVTPDSFDRIMDRYVGFGFRSAAVPLLTAAQLACLDEQRRRLGIGGRQFVQLMRQRAAARGRRHLDGAGFMALWKLFNDHGAGVPIPIAGHMNRGSAALLHLARHWCRMPADEFTLMRMHFGGVPRTSMLDNRAYLRMLYRFSAIGLRLPEPPPRVAGDVGMVTQAQANLIWGLWCDFDGWKGDVSPAALDAAIGSLTGMEGGLASLTRAGARAVIDRFIIPRLNDRRAAEDGGKPLSGSPPAGLDRPREHQGRRARRRG